MLLFSKVLGKVTLKKEELYKYHNKEHWFPLTPQDVDAEVQVIFISFFFYLSLLTVIFIDL